MKCPLTFKMYAYPDEGAVAKGGDCLKEECAWWDNEYNLCGLNRLSAGLTELIAVLSAIEAKMLN